MVHCDYVRAYAFGDAHFKRFSAELPARPCHISTHWVAIHLHNP